MSEAALPRPRRDPLLWIAILLRGMGQVMFQRSAATGALFLLGIAISSPRMAGGGLLGTAVGTLTALFLRLDRSEIEDGIYGFNATLVGVAVLFYLQPVPLVWAMVVGGSVAASVVTWLARRGLAFPTYTAPFVVCTWCVLLLAHGVGGHNIDHPAASAEIQPAGFVSKVLNGEAEVMFGANVYTGLCFAVGIALCSPWKAVLSIGGSIIGTLVAIYHHDPASSLSIGIYGYNAALAAIATYLARPSLLPPLVGAAISVPLVEWFPTSLGIPPLTAPFVVATWIVLAIMKSETYLGSR